MSRQQHLKIGPTAAPPGSVEKIAVLQRRATLGRPLFHPRDKSDFDGCPAVRFLLSRNGRLMRQEEVGRLCKRC